MWRGGLLTRLPIEVVFSNFYVLEGLLFLSLLEKNSSFLCCLVWEVLISMLVVTFSTWLASKLRLVDAMIVLGWLIVLDANLSGSLGSHHHSTREEEREA